MALKDSKLGLRLRELRKKAGLTQEELEDVFTSVSIRYENEKF